MQSCGGHQTVLFAVPSFSPGGEMLIEAVLSPSSPTLTQAVGSTSQRTLDDMVLGYIDPYFSET